MKIVNKIKNLEEYSESTTNCEQMMLLSYFYFRINMYYLHVVIYAFKIPSLNILFLHVS